MNDIFNDMQVEVGCEKLLLLTAYSSLRDSLKMAVLFPFIDLRKNWKKIKSYSGIWNVEKVLYM